MKSIGIAHLKRFVFLSSACPIPLDLDCQAAKNAKFYQLHCELRDVFPKHNAAYGCNQNMEQAKTEITERPESELE